MTLRRKLRPYRVNRRTGGQGCTNTARPMLSGGQGARDTAQLMLSGGQGARNEQTLLDRRTGGGVAEMLLS